MGSLQPAGPTPVIVPFWRPGVEQESSVPEPEEIRPGCFRRGAPGFLTLEQKGWPQLSWMEPEDEFPPLGSRKAHRIEKTVTSAPGYKVS